MPGAYPVRKGGGKNASNRKGLQGELTRGLPDHEGHPHDEGDREQADDSDKEQVPVDVAVVGRDVVFARLGPPWAAARRICRKRRRARASFAFERFDSAGTRQRRG